MESRSASTRGCNNLQPIISLIARCGCGSTSRPEAPPISQLHGASTCHSHSRLLTYRHDEAFGALAGDTVKCVGTFTAHYEAKPKRLSLHFQCVLEHVNNTETRLMTDASSADVTQQQQQDDGTRSSSAELEPVPHLWQVHFDVALKPTMFVVDEVTDSFSN